MLLCAGGFCAILLPLESARIVFVFAVNVKPGRDIASTAAFLDFENISISWFSLQLLMLSEVFKFSESSQFAFVRNIPFPPRTVSVNSRSPGADLFETKFSCNDYSGVLAVSYCSLCSFFENPHLPSREYSLDMLLCIQRFK